MKLKQYLSLLLIGFCLTSYGQKKDNKELQSKAEQFTQKVIHLITEKDDTALNQLTTSKVYCSLCFDEAPEKSYFVGKDAFYNKHISTIFNKELLERLGRNEIKFSFDGSDPGFKDRDYIVLYTTHRPNEFGDGHEGAQFVFWLKYEKGNFKLSGIETIP
ncbi:hypothetical protein [Chryseobacterium jejuense]|uniref:hypothetical protein n=1 Tax=Chryseobacterium jejuense TaxID=445960 RepID=UPI001AE55644|nr:hypothetical protein [Chryseobacterium jejuense]MBP2618129.1 hypothetical protein [Chryseobacterium jejuense]